MWNRFILPVDLGQLKMLDGTGSIRDTGFVATGFQKQHVPVGHFRQPIGYHGSG